MINKHYKEQRERKKSIKRFQRMSSHPRGKSSFDDLYKFSPDIYFMTGMDIARRRNS